MITELDTKRIEKVYSLEHTDIPKAFFTGVDTFRVTEGITSAIIVSQAIIVS
jgi:hypothetical protein